MLKGGDVQHNKDKNMYNYENKVDEDNYGNSCDQSTFVTNGGIIYMFA